MPTRTADTLKRGDVVRYHGYRWAVIEPSDSVGSMPLTETVPVFDATGKETRRISAKECCEPRLVLLGDKRGLATNHATYVIWPNAKRFKVVEFLDLEIRGARPEPHPEDKNGN